MRLKAKRTRESDIFFVEFSGKKVAKTIQWKPDIFLDLDDRNKPVSLEIVNYGKTPLRAIRKVVKEFQLKGNLEGMLRLAEAVKPRKHIPA